MFPEDFIHWLPWDGFFRAQEIDMNATRFLQQKGPTDLFSANALRSSALTSRNSSADAAERSRFLASNTDDSPADLPVLPPFESPSKGTMTPQNSLASQNTSFAQKDFLAQHGPFAQNTSSSQVLNPQKSDSSTSNFRESKIAQNFLSERKLQASKNGLLASQTMSPPVYRNLNPGFSAPLGFLIGPENRLVETAVHWLLEGVPVSFSDTKKGEDAKKDEVGGKTERNFSPEISTQRLVPFVQVPYLAPLVFYGPIGCGKTHLIRGLYREYLLMLAAGSFGSSDGKKTSAGQKRNSSLFKDADAPSKKSTAKGPSPFFSSESSVADNLSSKSLGVTHFSSKSSAATNGSWPALGATQDDLAFEDVSSLESLLAKWTSNRESGNEFEDENKRENERRGNANAEKGNRSKKEQQERFSTREHQEDFVWDASHFVFEPGRRPLGIYLTANEFYRSLSVALERKMISQFHRSFLTAQIVVIENVEELGSYPSGQQELLSLLDCCQNTQTLWIFSTRENPNELTLAQQGLFARLTSGLLIPVAFPSLSTRRVLLQQISQALKLNVSKELQDYLLTELPPSVNAIHGVLLQMSLQFGQSTAPPTLQNVVDLLSQRRTARTWTLDEIAKVTAKTLRLRLKDMRGKKRSQHLVLGRNLTIYLSRKLTDVTLKELGRWFSGRDHSTILRGFREICRRLGLEDPVVLTPLKKIVSILDVEDEYEKWLNS